MCTVYAVTELDLWHTYSPNAIAARFCAGVLMLEAGMSQKSIAETLNRSRDWVRKCATGHDIGSRGRETRELIARRTQ